MNLHFERPEPGSKDNFLVIQRDGIGIVWKIEEENALGRNFVDVHRRNRLFALAPKEGGFAEGICSNPVSWATAMCLGGVAARHQSWNPMT